MIEFITAISLWELVKHTTIWIVNLKRASKARKQASVDALRQVLLTAQQTSIYLHQLQKTGTASPKKEAELAKLWTELSFQLDDLKVHKLAKRCLINGKKWENPDQMDADDMAKADAGMDRIEQLARGLLAELN